jgi:sulfide dehydrogenase cytochrome subunit
MWSFVSLHIRQGATRRVRVPWFLLSITWVTLTHSPAATIAAGPSAEMLSLPCNGCHGQDGVSQGDHIPSIAGMNADYMSAAMVQFKEGRRSATIMNRISKGYKGYEFRKIARYFSAKDWKTVPTKPQRNLVERGRQLHQKHCAECHEDMGRYQDKDVPRIAGQRPGYLQTQIMLYYRGEEKLPQPTEMADRLSEIAEEDLPALSAFYGTVQ